MGFCGLPSFLRPFFQDAGIVTINVLAYRDWVFSGRSFPGFVWDACFKRVQVLRKNPDDREALMKEMMVVGDASRSDGGDSHIDVRMEFCCLVLANVQIRISSHVFVLQDVRRGSSFARMTESRWSLTSCVMSPTECCHTGFLHGCRHSLNDGIVCATDAMMVGKHASACGCGKDRISSLSGSGARVLFATIFDHVKTVTNRAVVGNARHFYNEIDSAGSDGLEGMMPHRSCISSTTFTSAFMATGIFASWEHSAEQASEVTCV